MPALEALFRWIHIVAGIVWIGHLYFFNFVNTPFAGTMDADTRKKVVPQLMPRALYWFRWGAAWTWVTGFLLLLIVFYHGRTVFEGFGEWTAGAVVMILLTFLLFFVYDALWKSPLAKDQRVGAAISFALLVVVVYAYIHVGGFSYRGYVIHVGTLFGTLMAANVWMRIWPMQKKIIAAVKEGTPPDPAWAALAGARSRHNVYMSVPLVWTMISAHTTTPFATSPLNLFLVILAGWGVVYLLYKKAGRVPGF